MPPKADSQEEQQVPGLSWAREAKRTTAAMRAAGIAVGSIPEERYHDLTSEELLQQLDRGLRGSAALDAALSARVQKVKRGRAPRHGGRRSSTSRPTASGGAGGDDPPRLEPRLCEGCGETFTPARRDQRHHSGHCRVIAHRRREAQALDQAELLERARLARRAVRRGANPYDALACVVVRTAAEARRMLGGAA